MGQITALSLGSNALDSGRAPALPSAGQAAFNRTIAGAASAVNDAGILGQNREVTFSVDPGTHRPVVRVLDVDTKEVIDQWPPEYLLELAQQAKIPARDSG